MVFSFFSYLQPLAFKLFYRWQAITSFGRPETTIPGRPSGIIKATGFRIFRIPDILQETPDWIQVIFGISVNPAQQNNFGNHFCFILNKLPRAISSNGPVISNLEGIVSFSTSAGIAILPSLLSRKRGVTKRSFEQVVRGIEESVRRGPNPVGDGSRDCWIDALTNNDGESLVIAFSP